MKQQFHNPQGFNFEQVGGPDGFRLLTVEEAAVFTDPLAARSEVGKQLAGRLLPELYNEAAGIWQRSQAIGTGQALIVSTTYRTAAPLPEPAPDFASVSPGQLALACADFVESWNFLAGHHHGIMVEKGFWNGERDLMAFLTKEGRPDLMATAVAAFDGQKIALHASELSEALDGLRHGNGPDDKIPEFNSAEAELADVLLRIMDHAHARGWNLARALVAKMDMNATRAAMHGGKQF
jgi:hypothetical protein